GQHCPDESKGCHSEARSARGILAARTLRLPEGRPIPQQRDSIMDARILIDFHSIVGKPGLVSSPEELHTYESDGLTKFRVLPRAVLLPSSTEQVQSIVRICHREKIPFVGRGSATGLSGGALPDETGTVLCLEP